MNVRRGARLAWGLFGVAVLLAVLGIWSLVLIWHVRFTGAEDPASDTWTTVAFLSMGAAGAVVAARIPGNAVGWLMLTIAISAGLGQLAYGYAVLGVYVHPAALPGARIAAWAANSAVWALGVVTSAPLLFQLFPTGRPVSRRWRTGLALPVLAGVMLVLASLGPGRLSNLPVQNPVAVPGGRFLEHLTGPAMLLFVVSLLIGLAAIVVRFRRAEAVERAQVQLVMLSIAAAIVVLVVQSVLTPGGIAGVVLNVANLATIVLAPVTLVVAMTRYHLYDIDRIISRTVLYSVLTALLVGVYTLIVVGIGTLTGRSNNPVLIAGATLAVAALFRPARRRLQNAIDRRLYRRRYDTERVLGSFAARLRDELDLGTLSAELQATVAQTVQPSRVGVWIRGGREPR